MGKSSNSCFKIIGCGGGDAVDDDDLSQEEVSSCWLVRTLSGIDASVASQFGVYACWNWRDPCGS